MRVLGIFAHPDDAEILAAGTLAKYSQRNDEVCVAITTNGDVGHPTLPREAISALRHTEAEKACELIGARLFWLGFRDEFLFDQTDTRLAIIDVIRACRPDVILTHWPQDLYNPDHSITGQIVNDVAIMTTVPAIQTTHPTCDRLPIVYFADSLAGVGFLPTEYVDITSTFDTKQAMLACHKSQIDDWLVDQYQVSMPEMVEVMARFRGIQAGTQYAEGFCRAQAWPRGLAGTRLP